MRLVIALALVAALTLLLVLFAGSRRVRLPEPFGPAANGSILSELSGDIYVSAPDGTNTRPLISGPTNDVGPWFTHDGTRFTFWRETGPSRMQLMISKADGTGLQPVTPTPFRSPDWLEFSPTDDRLALVHAVDGHRTLSILELASGRLSHIDLFRLEVDNNVLWLPPAGNELIFTARQVATSPTGAALYGIRPDGTGLRTIVPERSEEWPFLNLELSHDGKHLAYWMYEADDSPDKWGAHVHLVDVATGVDRRVVFDPANQDESELRFSPDGTWGVIVAADGSDAYLQVVDLAGTTPPRRIGPTFPGNVAKALGVSPDGKQVIFAVDNDKPMFIDVASGNVTTGPTEWAVFSSWQRLAP